MGSLAELSGSDTGLFFEQLGEVVNITKTAILGNGLDLQTGVFQQVFCVIDPLADNIGSYGHSGLFFEQGGQVAAVNVQLISQISKAEGRGKICVDTDHGLLHSGRVTLCRVVFDEPAIRTGNTANHSGTGGGGS